MSKRHDDWYILRSNVGYTRPDLIELGRKLLGYLLEQQRLSGVEHQAVFRITADGSKVSAQLTADLPIVTIEAKRSAPAAEPVEVGGFVLWPTDANGADALEVTDRIILAGEQYRGVREAAYSRLFPDGLNHAGNVDWQGRSGWVVSWYGPRTRYFESDPVLTPYVFSKGQPIVNASELVDTDAVVLGATITTAFGTGPWLVVVTEQFNFGQFEEVWAVRLVNPITGEPSKPTDAVLSTVADSYELLDSRLVTGEDVTARHPWFFNPTGTEGRRLVGTGSGLAERIITLEVDEDEETTCGFVVTRSSVIRSLAAEPENTGYTEATWGTHIGKWTAERRLEFDFSAAGFPVGAAPSGPDSEVFETGGTFATETTDGSYSFLTGLVDFEYERNITCAEVWQPVAVDYRPNGEVVYGYARHATIHETESGGFAPTAPLPDVTAAYVDNSWAGYYQNIHPDGEANPGVWTQRVDYTTNNYTTTGGPVVIDANYTTTEDSILGGLMVGTVQITAVRVSSVVQTGSASFSIPALGPTTGDFVMQGGDANIDPNRTIQTGPPLFSQSRHGGVGDNVSTNHSTVSSSTEELLYLIHMDLRYDALFVCTERDEETGTVTEVAEWTGFPSLPSEPTGTVETTTATTSKRTFHIRGYVHNDLVVEESVIAFETVVNNVDTDDVPAWGDGTPYTNIFAVNVWTEADVDGEYSNIFGVMPRLENWLPIIRNLSLPDGEVSVTPSTYPGPLTETPVDADFLYQLVDTDNPVYQQLTLSWHIEVDRSRVDNVGYSFGAGPNRVKVHWHTDADGHEHLGGWAYYKQEWAFSMSLPVPEADSTFNAVSLCRIGTVESKALRDGEDNVEHFYPVWVLPNTAGFAPMLS